MTTYDPWFFAPDARDMIEQSWLTGRATGVFTSEECDEIIRIGSKSLKESSVGYDQRKNIAVRDSSVNFLHPSEETNWIFERLDDTTQDINNTLFNFKINGFAEGLQFTKYEAPTGQYVSHIDRMNIGEPVRKLSMSVQLSNPEDYDGGDLEILTTLEHPEFAPRERGIAFYFNSHLLHRVNPVTRGTRYSLVAWITGPRFV